MGDVFPFPAGEELIPEELVELLTKPLEEMSERWITACLEALRRELAALDKNEPSMKNEELYEQWADDHEDIEDTIDELLDRLDEMK